MKSKPLTYNRCVGVKQREHDSRMQLKPLLVTCHSFKHLGHLKKLQVMRDCWSLFILTPLRNLFLVVLAVSSYLVLWIELNRALIDIFQLGIIMFIESSTISNGNNYV